MMTIPVRMLIVLICCSLAVAAHADPDPQARANADAAYAEGTKLYEANDFLRAAAKFQEAYAAVPDPAYLFNIGQAFRFGKDCDKAIEPYKQFVALAPDAPNVAKAKEHLQEVTGCVLFVEGRRLMGMGKPREACEKFAAAHELDPQASGTMLNLGLCHQQIGRLATALSWFRKAKTQAAKSRSPESEEAARDSIDALVPRTPVLRIELPADLPSDAIIRVDDKAIARTDVARMEVDPGPHVVELRLPGHEPVVRRFELGIGKEEVVKLAFERQRAASSGGSGTIYLLGGVGAGLFTGTIVLGIVGRDKYETARTRDTQETWKSAVRYGGTAMFVAGCAATAGAVYLYLKRPRTTERAALVPVFGGDQVGVAVNGSF